MAVLGTLPVTPPPPFARLPFARLSPLGVSLVLVSVRVAFQPRSHCLRYARPVAPPRTCRACIKRLGRA